MLSNVVIIGRPNVGKSTLFNCMVGKRQALVSDLPGMTRDRHYGVLEHAGKKVWLIDTGGLDARVSNELHQKMTNQTERALAEASVVVFVVDAKAGITSGDEEIVRQLRRSKKPVQLVVNKIDAKESEEDDVKATFYRLGFGEPFLLSAAHQRGVPELIAHLFEHYAALLEEPEETPEQAEGVRVALIGRPNVGKSTLVNRLLGEERVLVSNQAGTTRDSIDIPFHYRDRPYVLVDTAGVRRRGKIYESIEHLSVVKTLQSVHNADVVILMIDAAETVAEQDLHLLGFVLDAGKSLVIGVNKWDGLDPSQRAYIESELKRRLRFVEFAEVHFISAMHGTGVGHLWAAIDRAYESACKKVSTAKLTRLLEAATAKHQPPLVRGRRIKLRYAHMGGHLPPKMIVHGTQASRLPVSYQRYLLSYFREHLGLVGTPLRLEMREGENPYDPKKED